MNSHTPPHLRGQNCVVLGAQWGDEGKGKIVDAISSEFDLVTRFQGGHNAGHTLQVKDRQIIVHLIPSGILHTDCMCCIGSGVVLSPDALLDEVQQVEKAGITNVRERLIVDMSTAIILPGHIALDKANEQKRASSKIGTTCRGIGPAYEDKTARRGLRLRDLLDNNMPDKVKELVNYHNAILKNYYKVEVCDIDEIIATLVSQQQQLQQLAGHVGQTLHTAHNQRKRILFEGAQGVMLDLDQGTYPYVTSSNTLSSSIVPGTGFGFADIDSVIGITKAYTTRVGSGPFPTEQNNETGERLRKEGKEFGATTGRPRRCGWFDGYALKHMARINSMTSIYITKLDILDSFDEIKVGTTYSHPELNECPFDHPELANVEVQYQKFKGWQQPTSQCTTFNDLPQAAKDYIESLKKITGCSVGAVSVGPERSAIIYGIN